MDEDTLWLKNKLESIDRKLTEIQAFHEELLPFLEFAKRYTGATKMGKVRAMMGNG